MIAIIDGCGANIASVQFALERLGKESLLTTDADIIRSASHVILPGVGTAKQAMQSLQHLALTDVIRQLTQPVLGICLGMQLLHTFSEEGQVECLSIAPGNVVGMKPENGLTIPHMGWNQLTIKEENTTIFAGIEDGSFVYYVHSFAVPVYPHTIAMTNHGQPFSAAVQQGNFYGVQFHPERSGKTGEKILQNFLNL